MKLVNTTNILGNTTNILGNTTNILGNTTNELAFFRGIEHEKSIF